MSFTVVPAIDLLNGQVVRLVRGDYDAVTVYESDPPRLGLDWFKQGVRRLHLVDLDGARRGAPTNFGVVKKLASIQGLDVQVGGGIRTMDTASRYLDECGVRWIILGTVAHRDPEFVRRTCLRWPGRILVGLDARNGKVAVEGWLQQTEVSPIELGLELKGAGVAGFIYTDIQRDGTGAGPNIDSTVALAVATQLPVLGSGGVATEAHIRALRNYSQKGVHGVVVGKAILSGSMPIASALALNLT